MTAPVDVLAVMDYAASHFASERDDRDQNDDKDTGGVFERRRADMREARAAVAELVEAAKYARLVIEQLSEKAVGRGDREYCARILKDGNSIDAALAKFGGAK